MRSLYATLTKDLATDASQDLKNWGSIFKSISASISLVDRTGYVKMPYRYKIYEPFKMITDLSNFNLTYEECANKRAAELIELSRTLDKPITVMYSGGIDSSAVLISFMKALSPAELKDRVVVAMTRDSIGENQNLYYNYIRPNCNIQSSEYISTIINGDTIFVAGEHNDQLFGSDIIGNISRYGNYEDIHKPYSREFIVNWLNRSMDLQYSNIWFDIMDEQIKHAAPCEVSTNFHFFWWYNFCYKWQNVHFRTLMISDPSLRHMYTDDFLAKHYHHFFSSSDFQKWSMLNHHLKVESRWQSYKTETKRLIYDFNGDQEYRDSKVKSGSLWRLFLQRRIPIAITDTFEFIEKEDLSPNEFYDENNSFNKEF